MTAVEIKPGICGFTARVTAQANEDGDEVQLKVACGCKSVSDMMQELGDTFDAYELCLSQPGVNSMFQYAATHFPVHAACPVLAGIIKCAEAECKLALPADASIRFLPQP